MDIEIFPHRLLSTDTTERLLNDLEEVEGIKKIVIQGQRLPSADNNTERRIIKVKGEEIDLQVQTGRVFMEIEDEEIMRLPIKSPECVKRAGFGQILRKLLTGICL